MNAQCRKIRGNINRFFEGTLNRDDAGRFQEHIASCESCRTAFEAERRLIDGLATLPRLRCPRRVTEAVLGKTRSGSITAVRPAFWERWRIRHSWKPILAGVGAIAAALVLTRTVQKTPEEPIRYTPEEIRRAGETIRWSMAFSAQTIQQSEQRAVEDIFQRRLPETIRKSVQTAFPNFGGNQP